MNLRPLLFLLMLVPAAFPQEPERPALERKGTLVPSEFAPVQLRLEVFRGEMPIREAAAHGLPVNAGDILLRLDTTAIDDQIRKEEFALGQQEQKVREAEEEARLQEEAAADSLAEAQQQADHAQRRLENYMKVEREQNLERDRLNRDSSQDRIDDQKDELTQLEKMYGEDELVDATEEIVLKRQRRGLARTIAGFELQERQRTNAWEFHEALRRAEMELDVRNKVAALERQKRAREIARSRKEADLARARFDLADKRDFVAKLRRDRERMTLRAERGGLFLHGAADAAPGAGRLAAGGKAGLETVLAVVADPEKLAVATDVAETDVLRVPEGAAAEVTFTAVPDLKLMGRADLAYLPSSRGQDGANLYEARVALEKGDRRLRPGMRCTVTFLPPAR